MVVSSIRDILQPRGERREQETLALIDEFFDAVLVHGDPAVVPLGATFSLADRIVEKTVYTGYIAPPPVPRTLVEASAEGEIIVSAGGGAAGLRLYEAAIEAARIASKPHGWRILVGHGIEESEFRGLSRRAPENVLVERNRADFRELIAASAMLISQAGYNTIADIMVTGVPSLLVPFEGGGEMEQLERARRFEALGRCHMIREAELTADALARAGAAVLGEPEPVLPAMDLAGISHCADWLERRAVNY